jgi:hypothetical protein
MQAYTMSGSEGRAMAANASVCVYVDSLAKGMFLQMRRACVRADMIHDPSIYLFPHFHTHTHTHTHTHAISPTSRYACVCMQV